MGKGVLITALVFVSASIHGCAAQVTLPGSPPLSLITPAQLPLSGLYIQGATFYIVVSRAIVTASIAPNTNVTSIIEQAPFVALTACCAACAGDGGYCPVDGVGCCCADVVTYLYSAIEVCKAPLSCDATVVCASPPPQARLCCCRARR